MTLEKHQASLVLDGKLTLRSVYLATQVEDYLDAIKRETTENPWHQEDINKLAIICFNRAGISPPVRGFIKSGWGWLEKCIDMLASERDIEKAAHNSTKLSHEVYKNFWTDIVNICNNAGYDPTRGTIAEFLLLLLEAARQEKVWIQERNDARIMVEDLKAELKQATANALENLPEHTNSFDILWNEACKAVLENKEISLASFLEKMRRQGTEFWKPLGTPIWLRHPDEASINSNLPVFALYSDSTKIFTTEKAVAEHVIAKGTPHCIGWIHGMNGMPESFVLRRGNYLFRVQSVTTDEETKITEPTAPPPTEPPTPEPASTLLDRVQRMGPRIRAWYHERMAEVAREQDEMMALLTVAETHAALGTLNDVIRTAIDIEDIEFDATGDTNITGPLREVYDETFTEIWEERQDAENDAPENEDTAIPEAVAAEPWYRREGQPWTVVEDWDVWLSLDRTHLNMTRAQGIETPPSFCWYPDKGLVQVTSDVSPPEFDFQKLFKTLLEHPTAEALPPEPMRCRKLLCGATEQEWDEAYVRPLPMKQVPGRCPDCGAPWAFTSGLLRSEHPEHSFTGSRQPGCLATSRSDAPARSQRPPGPHQRRSKLRPHWAHEFLRVLRRPRLHGRRPLRTA